MSVYQCIADVRGKVRRHAHPRGKYADTPIRAGNTPIRRYADTPIRAGRVYRCIGVSVYRCGAVYATRSAGSLEHRHSV